MFLCIIRCATDCRHLVTVPFHQIIRSTTPLFVIAISVWFLDKSYPRQTFLTLIPVQTSYRAILIIGYHWCCSRHSRRLLLHDLRLPLNPPWHPPCCSKDHPNQPY